MHVQDVPKYLGCDQFWGQTNVLLIMGFSEEVLISTISLAFRIRPKRDHQITICRGSTPVRHVQLGLAKGVFHNPAASKPLMWRMVKTILGTDTRRFMIGRGTCPDFCTYTLVHSRLFDRCAIYKYCERAERCPICSGPN